MDGSPDGRKRLTLDALYGPENKIDFDGDYARGMVWQADGDRYWYRRDDKLLLVEAETGHAEPAFDHQKLQDALLALDFVDLKEAEGLVKGIRPTAEHPDRVLLEHNDRLLLADLRAATVTVLTDEPAERLEPTLSPRGEAVVFHRDGDLFLIDIASRRIQPLTTDGNDNILNGRLDWVYQEEVYGRGNWRANWFRDDDAFLAYLQLDQTDVPTFTILDHRGLAVANKTYHFPKPGDPNPAVKLGIIRLADQQQRWADLSKYAGLDIIICRVGWAPDGKLLCEVQDREGRWLELNDIDPETGALRTLLREESPAWVNPQPLPLWCADGSFIWRSERDGWAHLYHYDRDGTLRNRVTSGEWEVRQLFGIDPETSQVYFVGTKDTVLEHHVYRVNINTQIIERLTEPGSFHAAEFDPTYRFFFDTFSNVTTPPKVHLRTSDGALVRVLSANEVDVLKEYALVAPEFLKVPNGRGFDMNAMLWKPTNFDSQKRYPVVSEVYGGPHAAMVSNRWQGTGGLFRQLLAQHGFVYWVCDPETASGEGMVTAWKAYKQLGVLEVQDLEAGINWLAQHDWIDADRVALNGWSYGGFVTAYALTQTDVFAVGIAGAGLSDWRLYDSIYTERFMQTPANNLEGYQKTSVLEHAHQLNGRLLLVHGTLDDNVHLQNTLSLAHKLQAHGKDFDLMLYPGSKHGISENRRHWVQLRLDYLREHLNVEE